MPITTRTPAPRLESNPAGTRWISAGLELVAMAGLVPNETRHTTECVGYCLLPRAKAMRILRRPAMARKRCGRTSQKVGMPPTDGAGFAAGSGLARQAPLNQIDSPQTPPRFSLCPSNGSPHVEGSFGPRLELPSHLPSLPEASSWRGIA